MAMAYNIPPQQISTVDALWSLIVNQPDVVRNELFNRVRTLSPDYKDTEDFPVMSVAEVEARFDQIEREVAEGHTLTSDEVHKNIAEKCPWL